MTATKELFSILIPTWNNLAFLKLCIESIRKNSDYRHEILIHVNCGDDGNSDEGFSYDITMEFEKIK